ncbi:family 1 glycosylhydrolase [Peribacillus frigoritolerans]|nr:family 1 glycosylhydrolase [Peribacillus frigoritolerans]
MSKMYLSDSGYRTGLHPPGVKDSKRMYEANHIANLANAKAIQSFRRFVPDGKIGPSFAFWTRHTHLLVPRRISLLMKMPRISITIGGWMFIAGEPIL